MAKVELLVSHLSKWEGGFVNNLKDKGGATMRGVTLSTYKSYCRKKGRPEPTVEDLKNISDSDWGEIVVFGYWGKMQADKIDNQSVANIMVDWLFNSGVGKIKNIQRIVGVTPDGIVGQKTLLAINQAKQKDLFDKIKAARIQFYYDIVKNKPDQKIFLKGWLNRVNDYKYSQQ